MWKECMRVSIFMCCVLCAVVLSLLCLYSGLIVRYKWEHQFASEL